MLGAMNDFDKKGFLVVPKFMNEKEVSKLLEDFNTIKNANLERVNPNFNTRFAGADIRKQFETKILDFGAKISSLTSTKVDQVSVGVYFAAELGVKFDWHTDTTSFFTYQDHCNYLNFWIPIQKPNSKKSGMQVVPFDALADKYPELYFRFVGHGGTPVQIRDGKTVFYDYERAEVLEYHDPNLLSDISVTPELSPGDLFLWRGDAFHKTQDADTDRVAISFRLVNSESSISRHKLMKMGAGKFVTLANDMERIKRRFAAFQVAGRDVIKLWEYEFIFEELAKLEKIKCDQLNTKKLSDLEFMDLVFDFSASYHINRKPKSGLR